MALLLVRMLDMCLPFQMRRVCACLHDLPFRAVRNVFLTCATGALSFRLRHPLADASPDLPAKS